MIESPRTAARFTQLYKVCSILMLAIVATTVLMIYPEVALWLPRTMR